MSNVRSLLRIKQRQMIHEQQYRMSHPSAAGGSTSGTSSGPLGGPPLGGRPAAEVAAEQRRGWWELPKPQAYPSPEDGGSWGRSGGSTSASGVTSGGGIGAPPASAERGKFSDDGELRLGEEGVLSSSSGAWTPSSNGATAAAAAAGAAVRRPGVVVSGSGAKSSGKGGDAWLVITDDEPS
jgi:hypothetical protein